MAKKTSKRRKRTAGKKSKKRQESYLKRVKDCLRDRNHDSKGLKTRSGSEIWAKLAVCFLAFLRSAIASGRLKTWNLDIGDHIRMNLQSLASPELQKSTLNPPSQYIKIQQVEAPPPRGYPPYQPIRFNLKLLGSQIDLNYCRYTKMFKTPKNTNSGQNNLLVLICKGSSIVPVEIARKQHQSSKMTKLLNTFSMVVDRPQKPIGYRNNGYSCYSVEYSETLDALVVACEEIYSVSSSTFRGGYFGVIKWSQSAQGYQMMPFYPDLTEKYSSDNLFSNWRFRWELASLDGSVVQKLPGANFRAILAYGRLDKDQKVISSTVCYALLKVDTKTSKITIESDLGKFLCLSPTPLTNGHLSQPNFKQIPKIVEKIRRKKFKK